MYDTCMSYEEEDTYMHCNIVTIILVRYRYYVLRCMCVANVLLMCCIVTIILVRCPYYVLRCMCVANVLLMCCIVTKY